jgi:PKD domain
VVAWIEGSNPNATVKTATRQPGGPFGPVDTLAGPTSGLGGPRVAVAPDGTTLITWVESIGLRYAVRPPGGSFGPSEDMPKPALENVNSAAEIAFDPQGNAVAAWIGSEQRPPPGGGRDVRLRASRRPAGGDFESPVILDGGYENADAIGTPSFQISGLDLAAAGGDVIAAWSRWCCMVGSETSLVRFATRPAGGAFAPDQTIDTGMGTSGVIGPRLAGSTNGSAVLVWGQHPTPGTGRVVGCGRPPAGSFSGCTIEQVAPPGTSPSNPSLGIDAQGNAVAAWSRDAPTASDPSVVQTAGRPAGSGAWSSLGTFSEAGVDLTGPQVAVSGAGTSILAWRRGLDRSEGAFRLRGAAFGPRRTLSQPGGSNIFPEVAMDPAGNGAAMWERFVGMSTAGVQLAGFDAAGPRLTGLTIPATGATRQSLPFGVTATDVWSPVQSVGWSFGDGTNATGARVTHTYGGTGGNLTAAVTATDSLGNATTAARAIRIRDATRPVLSRLRMRFRRFAVGRARTPVVAQRLPRGSAFRFRLSERATVKIRIDRKVRRRGRTVHRKVKVLTRRGLRAGARRVKFSGRIRRRALRPGAYRATLTAIDPSRNRSRKRTTTFRILSGR